MATTETMPFGLIRKRKNGQLFTLSARLKKEGYISHLRPHGEEIAEKDKNPDFYKARRWAVEVCHSWFNLFRKLLVRYEKMDRSYLGLLMPAASVIVLRKVKRQNMSNIIYG